MISRSLFIAAMALLTIFSVITNGHAGTSEQAQSEIEKALKVAKAATKEGPADIPFAGQATFHLPKDFGFIPATEAKALLEAMGNRVGEGFIGLVIPNGENDGGWFVAATFNKAGYVKDDDAKDWKADELLKSIREGTEETNKSRKERGIPEMEILGWVQKPSYDAATHRLIWSVASRHKGEPDSAEQGINYNTLALGREGYISMNMVTGRASIEGLKPVAQSLLSVLEFNAGKKYADFNASTDKVAAYGLAAIVAGVAAKKLGLLAVVIGFFAKFAKVIALAFIAGFGGLFKKFRRKKDEDVPQPAQLSPPPSVDGAP